MIDVSQFPPLGQLPAVCEAIAQRIEKLKTDKRLLEYVYCTDNSLNHIRMPVSAAVERELGCTIYAGPFADPVVEACVADPSGENLLCTKSEPAGPGLAEQLREEIRAGESPIQEVIDRSFRRKPSRKPVMPKDSTGRHEVTPTWAALASRCIAYVMAEFTILRVRLKTREETNA